MPRATVASNTERFDLRTAPPDGYVLLRRLTYGEVLKRRDMGTKMQLDQNARGRSQAITIDMIQTETTWFEFKSCIMDHNLEDESGRKLDFNNRVDFQNLDPRVAQEIEQFIAQMNGFGDEDTEGLFRPDQSLGSTEQAE